MTLEELLENHAGLCLDNAPERQQLAGALRLFLKDNTPDPPTRAALSLCCKDELIDEVLELYLDRVAKP